MRTRLSEGPARQMPTGPRRTSGVIARSLLRTALWVLGAFLALVLLCGLLIAQRSVRDRILAAAIARADRSLPGNLAVEEAEWPRLGAIELAGLQWIDRADTLAAVESLSVSVEPSRLLHRELQVRHLRIVATALDLPAALQRLAPRAEPAGAARRATASRYRGSLLREGALPGLPALSLEDLRVAARAIRLASGTELADLLIEGSLDLRPGQPHVRLRRLAVREPAHGLCLDDLHLDLDLVARVASGSGSGTLGEGWPYRLLIHPAGPGSVDLQILHGVRTVFDSGHERAVVDLHALLIPCGAEVCSLSCTALLRTPSIGELASHPMLAKPLAGWPDLEGITLEMEAGVRMRPLPAGRISVTLQPNAWLEGGGVALGYEEGNLSVDTVSVRMPDLAVGAQGSVVDGQLRAAARATVRGMRWLERLGPKRLPIDSLHADLLLGIQGNPRAIAAEAELNAAAVVAGVRIDSLRVLARIPDAVDSAATAHLRVRGAQHLLSTRARLLRGDTLHLALDPLRLVRLPAGGASGPGESSVALSATPSPRPQHPVAQIDYVPGAQSVRIEGLHLTGDYGDLLLSGALTEARELALRLRADWPAPPCGLRHLLDIEGSRWDSLSAAWHTDGPFNLDLRARGTIPVPGSDGQNPAFSLRAETAMLLPGPRTLRAWLPPATEVDDLGPVDGTLEILSDGGGVTLDLDLVRTAWLDTARVITGVRDRQLTLETLLLSTEGLQVAVSGERADSLWDLHARLDLASTALLERAGMPCDSLAEIFLTAEAELHGTATQPALAVRAAGRWDSPDLRIPQVTAIAHRGAAGVALDLKAPQGLWSEFVEFDSLRVDYRGTEAGALLPGEFFLAASGQKLAWLQRLRLDRDDAWILRTDTLRIAAGGRDLVSRRPFVVRVDDDPRRFEISGLDLQGDLGLVRTDGWITPDGAEFSGRASLHLPESAPVAAIPPGLWPRRCEADFAASGWDQMHAGLRLEGLSPAGRRLEEVRVEIEANSDGLTGQATAADSAGVILKMDAHLPGHISLYPLAAELREGPARGDLRLTRFPVPLTVRADGGERTPGRAAQIDAELVLRGTSASPFAYAIGRAHLTDMPKVSRFALDFDLLLAPLPELPPEIADRQEQSALGRLRDGPPVEGGLSAAIALVRSEPQRLGRGGAQSTPPLRLEDPQREAPALGGAGAAPAAASRLLTGIVQFPLRCSLAPPVIATCPERRFALRLESHDLPLDEFDPLLPGDAGLGGTLSLLLTAEGLMEDPDLGGELDAQRVRLSTADGTNVTADVEMQLTGTGRHPSLAGQVEVERGLIIIPEPPRSLHPVEGRAALWESTAAPDGAPAAAAALAESGSVPAPETDGAAEIEAAPGAAPGSGKAETVAHSGDVSKVAASGGRAPEAARDTAPSETAAIDPSVEIGIVIPSGLWLRGRGLEVEMAGDLRVVRRGTSPAITGELRAVRGHLVFLGRIFQVESGRATFYGEDEINPSLDLVLATRIEGTAIRVLFRGTPQEPEIGFSSDPEMEEGDIIAFLLFGRRLDELDNDQMNLLQRRAAEVAASYGAAQFEARLSRQLGVDMVTIRRGSSGNGATALLVGKYLSRRALLRYEQALEDPATIFLNLEYFLSRHLKIDTMVGSRGQSGVELNWATEY